MATMGARAGKPLATMRASVIKLRKDGERVVGRVRRDAEALIDRSRSEVLKEVRDLERRVLKAFHGATEERVTRLEKRIAKLEEAVATMHKSPGSVAV